MTDAVLLSPEIQAAIEREVERRMRVGPRFMAYRGHEFHTKARRRVYELIKERAVICGQDDVYTDPELQAFTGWAQPVQWLRELRKFLVTDPVPFPYPPREAGQELIVSFVVPGRRPVYVCLKSALHCGVEIAIIKEHERKRMSEGERAQKLRRLRERYGAVDASACSGCGGLMTP